MGGGADFRLVESVPSAARSLPGGSLALFAKWSDKDEKEMELKVNCYSGRKADERPVRFRLDKHDYTVEEVLDQWYGPDDVFYKVRAQDGNVYVLRQQTSDGSWHLAAFRQST